MVTQHFRTKKKAQLHPLPHGSLNQHIWERQLKYTGDVGSTDQQCERDLRLPHRSCVQFPTRQRRKTIPTHDPMFGSRRPCSERTQRDDSGVGRPAWKGQLKVLKSVQLG